MTAYRTFELRSLAGALGAEIDGIDLAHLTAEEFSKIRQAFLDHLVIFFHDQELTPAQHKEFTARFGALSCMPYVKALDEHPEIIAVLKEADEQKISVFGGAWHSDFSFLEEPPLGSVLYALDVPPYGGDTLWSNMYAAYDALSDGMKRLLDGLRAVNSSAKADASRTREDRIAERGRDDARTLYEASHPVVRVHPETGRPALYVNVAHTVRFEGMTEEESAPILAYLYRHQVRPEFTCRFRWQPGSLAFWDNRCAQHNAVNDYAGHRRLMHRITLAGDVPAGAT